MLARIAIPVGAFLIWCFVCQHWYVCHIKKVCKSAEPSVEIVDEQPTETTPDLRPLVFNWTDPTAVTRASFGALKDSIVSGLPEGHILEIVGNYFDGEEAPEGFPNMGMARAAQIRGLIGDLLPSDRVLVSSRLAKKPDDAETNPFIAHFFNYLEQKEEEEVEIVEVSNQITIQFPFNSSKKEADPKVDEYLEKLSERLKQTEEKVSIVGHTDDVGQEDANLVLGRARARQIQNILISKGISKNRITIDSRGESDPTADNSSEAGRRRNRRAVLTIN